MALNIISNVQLDMKAPNTVIVYANQYDSAGSVRAQLLNSGESWAVPAGAKAVVMFKKSDNIGGFYDVTEFGVAAVEIDSDRSVIYINYDPQVLTTAGRVAVQINFYQNDQRLSSFAFYTDVQASAVTSGEIASSWLFNILSQEIAQTLTVATTPQAMRDWLETNIHPYQGYPIDDTLTVPGAAADAEAVGKMVVVSNLNPNRVANKVWVKKTPATLEIPTMEELSDIFETLSLASINAYADRANGWLIADANSKTFLLDITRPDIERYIISINGNSNRCRLLAFTEPIERVGVDSAGRFTDLGDNTKQFILDKSNYASYKTISITTNYQSTPLASSVDVILIHDESLWEKVINDEFVIDGLSDEVSNLNSAVQSCETLLNKQVDTRILLAYIDKVKTKIIADSNSRTYLIDISSDDVDYYVLRTDGNNNRFRILAFTDSITDVTIDSVGAYTELANDTTEARIYKTDYLTYNTLAIATNYQLTPLAELSVFAHSAGNLFDDINELNNDINGINNELNNDINGIYNDINGIYKSIKNKFSGEVIVADSVSGYINFNEIPQVDCTVKSIGKNLFNYETAEYGTINASTGEDDDSFLGAVRSEDFLPILPSTDYTMSAKRTCFWLRLALYDENKTFIERIERRVPDTKHQTIRTTKNAKYARLIVNVQSLPTQPSYSIQSVGIMFAMGSETPVFEDYQSSSVTISNGIISGQLKSYNESTLVHADYETSLNVNIPINVINYIESYFSSEELSYTETECRERFRLEMREKAKRIGMNDTIVGDGAGHPVNTSITALDAIKMLCHAMSYQEIANTWSYDTKVIRTKGIVNTITMNSTLFKDAYISDLTDYYTVLGFKTGSGSTHNLVCACTSDDLEGKVLVGCICLSQVTDDANINRPKAMKTLMDMGKVLVKNRSADVSSYVSAMTAMTATRFTVILLPNCNTKLLQRYNFNGSYSMLYNYSSATFISWSMIKLLCAMTALDFMKDLDEANEVVYSDLLIGTGAYGPLFQEGEIITYRDAISALLIPSCNQAAYFLERLIGKKILNEYGENGFLPTE